MPDTRLRTSTVDVPNPEEGLSALVRRAALIAVFCSFASVPVSLILMGPVGGMGGLLAGAAFLVIPWRLDRGDLRFASAWLVATVAISAALSHFTYGGLAGFGVGLLSSVPLLSILGTRRIQITGVGLFGFAVVSLGISFLMTDRWWNGEPTAEVIRLLRTGVVSLVVCAYGMLAAHAVRRLELANEAAMASEHHANRASERKTSFLANISHELRTPMNAIMGYSELVLEDEAATTDMRQDVARIRQAGEELLALINEVLQVARSEADGTSERRSIAVGALVQRWIGSSAGRFVLGAPGDVPLTLALVDIERLDRLVSEIADGYRRRNVEQVTLCIIVRPDAVVATFRPIGDVRRDAMGTTLWWVLAERSASAVGVRLRRRPHATIQLTVPLRPEASARSHPPLPRWPFGIRFPVPSARPMEALRVRLSIWLAWMSLAIVTFVGPVTMALDGGGLTPALAVLAWGGLVIGVLVLFRVGCHRLAGTTLAAGQIVALTAIQAWFGGTADVGMVYYPIVVVLGTLIMGSRGGAWPTVLALVGITMLGVADPFGLLPPAPPDSRFVVLFVGCVATGLSTVLVAMWAQPLARLVASAHDAAIRASEADRATSDFLDVVSIELRTPLNAILGYAELLLEDPGHPPEIRSDLHRILDAGRHLLAVVDDLLDMSAIVADQLEIDADDVEMASLMSSILVVAQPLIEQRDNRLRVHIAANATRVLADPKRLRQILLNLISNAAKFTENGTVAVDVVRDGEQVVISVEDTGIGIAPADLRQLFQPFSQVHHGNPGQYGGTGLGLAISRRLARKMDGDIKVRSTLGRGSTFSVFLPVGTATVAVTAS